jgi:predicted MPP superfamily phosphohydrolase
MYKIGTSWLFISIYIFLLLLLLELLRFIHILPEKYMVESWVGFLTLSVTIIIIMTLGYIKYQNKERIELTLNTGKITLKEQPLKIVAVSDMHLGYSIGNDELEKWVDLINREKPDIVLIAGDIIDNSVQPLIEEKTYDILQKLQTKYGVYTVPGNHEYIASIDKSLDFLHKSNIQVLRDSVVLIDDQFYIAGRDDKTNKERKTTGQLIERLDKSKPIILLDHQPYHLEETEENQIDLQFSGHTHRGQIWPFSWVTDVLYEKSHGYLKKGNSHIYVSSGIGVWGGKFCIGTQSEYVVIHLD